jgi:hypothetical protein
MEGKEPTLKDKLLQKELATHHLRLEPQVVTQNQTKSRNKNSGRQVLPNTPTNNRTGAMKMDTTAQPSGNAAPANAAPIPGPADRMEAQLRAIADGMKPDPLWVTGAKIGVAAVVLFGVSVAAGVTVSKLTSSGTPAAKKL